MGNDFQLYTPRRRPGLLNRFNLDSQPESSLYGPNFTDEESGFSGDRELQDRPGNIADPDSSPHPAIGSEFGPARIAQPQTAQPTTLDQIKQLLLSPLDVSKKRRVAAAIAGFFGGPALAEEITGYAGRQRQIGQLANLYGMERQQAGDISAQTERASQSQEQSARADLYRKQAANFGQPNAVQRQQAANKLSDELRATWLANPGIEPGQFATYARGLAKQHGVDDLLTDEHIAAITGLGRKAEPSEAGKIAPEIEAQIGSRPDPKDYALGTKDPGYKAASIAWGQAAEKIKNREVAASATARGMSFGLGRFQNMLDTQQENRPVMVTGQEIQENPGRYISAGAGTAALTKTALIQDIRGAISRMSAALNKMGDESFNKTQRALLAAALASPAGQGSQYIDSLVREGITEAQQDYVIQTYQLKENAMAMRPVLGAGQGSEDLRNAIFATLPGAGTPTRAYGKRQLEALTSQLDRLERGVPRVPLRTDIGGDPPPGATHAVKDRNGKIIGYTSDGKTMTPVP